VTFNREERLRFLSEKEIETPLSVCAAHSHPIVVIALEKGRDLKACMESGRLRAWVYYSRSEREQESEQGRNQKPVETGDTD